jgi:hypothetical protein
MSSIKKILRECVIVGITWSNNGDGDNIKRCKISRDIGKYQNIIKMNEIQESPIENGYGD